jgi:hypothetical protein
VIIFRVVKARVGRVVADRDCLTFCQLVLYPPIIGDSFNFELIVRCRRLTGIAVTAASCGCAWIGFLDVACGRNCGPRFGGSTGEVQVYSDDAATIERSIVTEVRGQYPQVGRD